jgi:phenylacetate-CoA ligase
MTSLYTSMVSGVLFPLQERLKGHRTVAARRRLESSQWWDRGRIAELQRARLRRLLDSAYARCPYYRRLMDERGLRPGQLREPADLVRLPTLTKALIRAHTDDIRARHARGLRRFNTGGSTGEPLVFYIGAERVSHDVAAKWRATRWWGVDIGDPEIVVWGSPVELGTQDRLRELRDRLMRTRLVPAFAMSEENLAGFVSTIRAHRPRMLFGYPSALAHIARYARAQNQHMDDLGIRVAFVTAERLYEDQRQVIREVFGCPVANGYGGRDAGFLAHECPDGGMHITAEDVIVEILDDQQQPCAPGQAGEVVITHLATPDFPFVRYRTGDVAVLDSRACRCGRGLPLIGEVQGRATDFVITADGTVMHGLALIYVIRDLPEVRRFRIVQESREHTRVLVEPGAGYGSHVAQRIREGLLERLGSGVRVDVEATNRIPPEKSGKFRYVLSKAAPSG